jgi:hypothetical protein
MRLPPVKTRFQHYAQLISDTVSLRGTPQCGIVRRSNLNLREIATLDLDTLFQDDSISSSQGQIQRPSSIR